MDKLTKLRRAKLQRTRAQVVDTIAIGTPHDDASRHELAVRRVRDALALIELHDPERYRLVCQAIDVIWVFPMRSNIASLAIEDGAFICRISYMVVMWWPAELVASAIVHEAAHARLMHIGVHFAVPPALCEAYCVLQQRLFAKRAGNTEKVDALLDGYVEGWHDMIAFHADRIVTDDRMEVAFYKGVPVGLLYLAYDIEVWWTETAAPLLRDVWVWVKRVCGPRRTSACPVVLLGPPARSVARANPEAEALAVGPA